MRIPNHAGVALLLALLAAPSTGSAAALDKGAERWLRQVHLLILPDEEALFRSLPSAEDRKEFQRIFWARRDRDATRERSPLQETLGRAQARADDLFALPGTRGSETGCGQVFALLGDPLEVEGSAPGQSQGRGAREHFDSLQAMREGSRHPETWVYRSRPGEAPGFTGGELRIPFDEACRFSEGGRVMEDLRHVAEQRVVRPDLAYRTGADGHLVRLDELLRTAADGGAGHEARAILETERKDFPLEAETKLLLRTQAGQVYAAGLLRWKPVAAEGAAAPPSEPVAGTVAARAVPVAGPPSAVDERAFAAKSAPDGTFSASFGLSLKPGSYTVRVALRLADGRASVASLPLEVPDFEAPGLKAASLVLYPDETPAAADPRDPYSALKVGPLPIRPRFGNVFSAADALQVVSVLYGGKADASGKATLRARFSILRDGKPMAKGEDQVLETPMAVASVGPLPLAGFAPGRYLVKLEAADDGAGSSTTQEASFEVR